MQRMENSKIFSTEFVKNMKPGDTYPIEQSIADQLMRTGLRVRDTKNWANVYQVNVDGELCDLIYYDRGSIELQKGSDLD